MVSTQAVCYPFIRDPHGAAETARIRSRALLLTMRTPVRLASEPTTMQLMRSTRDALLSDAPLFALWKAAERCELKWSTRWHTGALYRT